MVFINHLNPNTLLMHNKVIGVGGVLGFMNGVGVGTPFIMLPFSKTPTPFIKVFTSEGHSLEDVHCTIYYINHCTAEND